MVDSAPQWEAVLRRQKEKNQGDPNFRKSRHRSRSYVKYKCTICLKHMINITSTPKLCNWIFINLSSYTAWSSA